MSDRPTKPSPPDYVPAHDLLKGKNVLMTAAAGAGIGFATAQRCVEEGARLFISDIHERRTAEAAAKLAEIGGRPVGHRLCNVREDADVRALVAAAIDEMGRIDVVINNAGLGGETPIVDMTDDQWDAVLDITLNSVFRMTRAVLPHMMERRAGVIVNNASVLGWRAQKGQAHYAAAKAGVMALTRCSALEAAEYGVRINAVSPSLAVHPFLVKTTPQELIDELEAKEAFGRGAAPWEVANVMVFLASDYSSYMTGEVVSVSSQRA
ncbi:MAG: SDR family oxidoreductase [Spirochaetaceae bacterium]|nr:SDR family oxidoreductase [Myxococcales bacterium]MCB9722735.1 SDR family oxidoreductase [Spirochaetaceae bacterium]HPG26404.1 SDR family oxidoreductase [Myxococcota bacterium]